MGLLALAALVAIGAAVGPPDEDDTADREANNSNPAATVSTGPELVSRNSANPPQQDLHDDTECLLGTLGWVTAEGTLTNHSAEMSMYMIHVAFNDASGVRFAEGTAMHIDVRPGESVRWDASGLKQPTGHDWTCEVVSIERFASQ